MANTGFKYRNPLFIDDNGSPLTITVDPDWTAQELSEATGGVLNATQAQAALDAQRVQDESDCKTCFDPLPPGIFYGDFTDTNAIGDRIQPSAFVQVDDNIECLCFANY